MVLGRQELPADLKNDLRLDRAQVIADELSLNRGQVARTLELIDGGATLPFIARYRKEVTAGLDEVQIGAVRDRGEYLRELSARKETVLSEIIKQGKLTPSLRSKIVGTLSKTELEDLYLPYKPKRRTRATIAREKGLLPLAEVIIAQADAAPSRDQLAAPYLSDEHGLHDTDEVFAGARDIVAEMIADTADVRSRLRDLAMATGIMRSQQVARHDDEDDDGPAPGNEREPGQPAPPRAMPQKKEDPAAKFSDYFAYEEAVKTIPSHRMLALRRGEKEGFLKVTFDVDRQAAVDQVRHVVIRNPRAALLGELQLAVGDSWDRLLKPAIEVDVRLALRERADAEAIRVFAENMRHLLLSSPLGGKRVLALDPGFRTGCKVAVIDEKGDFKTSDVIFPTQSEGRRLEAVDKLERLCAQHRIQAIAIGNGTAGRETEAFVRKLSAIGKLPGVKVLVVNEAGASVYSASEIAREELPDQDVTVRGAVSIGRRLQDPLAELVKIDPKSIGVGQYQHDVHQPTLKKQLDQVVESCVNLVGVDLNTASPKLLQYVAGVGETLAKNIVEHRSQHGPFRTRRQLLDVPRLGPKAFEQAAGFLRISPGSEQGVLENPLDNSAVHPESYDVVERMAAALQVPVRDLMGQRELLTRIDPLKFVDDRRGEPTIRDILSELEKPGRDPRSEFEEVGFNPEVTEFEHLREGMVLSGVITNVTNFGAFVDIGVHQDGLVHVSELAHRFIKDPAEVAKVGDRVKVRVVKLDMERRRIGLSVKAATEPPKPAAPAPEARGAGPGAGRGGQGQAGHGDRGGHAPPRQGQGGRPAHAEQGRGGGGPPRRGPQGGDDRRPREEDRDRGKGPGGDRRPRDEGGGGAPARGSDAAAKPFNTPFNQIRIRTK